MVSNSVIGLVLVRSPFHWSFFGIRMTIASFQACGVSACLRHWFNKFKRIWSKEVGAFFQTSFGILDGPGLFLFGMSLIVFSSSSIVMRSMSWSKWLW